MLRRPQSGPRRMRPGRQSKSALAVSKNVSVQVGNSRLGCRPPPSRLAEFIIERAPSGGTRWLAPQDDERRLGRGQPRSGAPHIFGYASASTNALQVSVGRCEPSQTGCPPDRRAAPRLAPPYPQPECRPAHVPHPRQSFRRRARRARGAAVTGAAAPAARRKSARAPTRSARSRRRKSLASRSWPWANPAIRRGCR